MASLEYCEAATEVLAILDNTEIEVVNKIPERFINFLKENSSKTYNPNFDTSKPIKELKLKPKTEALLGIIYLKYLNISKDEEIAFKKRIKENEFKYQQELREKYNIENLFKDRENTIKVNENKQQVKALVEIGEETFINKIINKIKGIFRRGRNVK